MISQAQKYALGGLLSYHQERYIPIYQCFTLGDTRGRHPEHIFGPGRSCLSLPLNNAESPIDVSLLNSRFSNFSISLVQYNDCASIFHQYALPWHSFSIPLQPGWANNTLYSTCNTLGQRMRRQALPYSNPCAI